MKAQIENRIENATLEGIEAFVSLLNDIQDCKNEKELREVMLYGENVAWYDNFFTVGFGRGHMWVKERVNGAISMKRLIFVGF